LGRLQTSEKQELATTLQGLCKTVLINALNDFPMLSRILKEYGGKPTAYDGGYAPYFQMRTHAAPVLAVAGNVLKPLKNGNKKTIPGHLNARGWLKVHYLSRCLVCSG